MNFIDNLLSTIQANRKSHFWLFFALLFVLTLFMMYCFGSSSSHSGYDFYFHYRRLYTLADAIQHGVYPNFYLDFDNLEGYGYFTKGFYSDVILVPFAVIAIFTNTYFAYDVMIFTMTMLCGMFMYHAVNVIYESSYAASVSAILYTFAIYRLYDIYNRGALGEALSFTFLPIVFLGLYYIIKADYKKWYVLALGYSLLIFTHVIASVLMFVTLLIILIIYYKPLLKEPKRIGYLLLAGLLTVLLVAYYLFPTIEQLFSNSFYLDSRSPGGGAGYNKVDYNFFLWGFISGIAYPKDKVWAGVGIVLILVLFMRFFIKKQKTEALKSVDWGVVIGICFVVITLKVFPWGRFPLNLLSFIQYPWRLYEFATYFFAIAGGYYLSLLFLKNRQRFFAFAVIIIITVVTTYIQSENYKYLHSTYYSSVYLKEDPHEPEFDNRYHLIGQEYIPSKTPDAYFIFTRGRVVKLRNEDTSISALRKEYNKTIFDICVNKLDTLELPLLYYHGYNVTLDGKNIPVNESDKGLIEVFVDQSGKIEAYYGGTTVQKASFYISLITILLLCIYNVLSNKRNKKDAAG